MNELNQVNDELMQRPFSVGEALTAGRKAKKIDIDDVCAYLRLSQRQVIALENNDFAVLPEATITRGFIRNYARMLALDPEPLVRAYAAFSATNQPQQISIPSANILMPGHDKRPWMLYVFASGLIVLLVLAWMIYMDDRAKPSSEVSLRPAATETTQLNERQTTVLLDLSKPANTEAVISSPKAEAPAFNHDIPADIPKPEESVADVAVPSSRAEIRIQSRESSWVRITDAGNNKIFDKILASGVEEVLQGQPPFQVIVGNAPSTTLVFNQKTVDLAPLTGSDKVARLKLE